MLRLRYIYILLFFVAIYACNKAEVSVSDECFIEFSTPEIQETKATSPLISDISGMVSGSGELGYSVYGLKTAVSPGGVNISDHFMLNEKIYSVDNGTTWKYDNKKFWSPSAKHYFFALYPYYSTEEDVYDHGVCYSVDKEIGNIIVKGKDEGSLYTGEYIGNGSLSTSPDILYGMSLHTDPFDVSATPEKVSFEMKHAFAAISFRIKNISEFNITSITPVDGGSNINITGLYNAATSLVLNSDGAQWPESTTGISTTAEFEFILDEVIPSAEDPWSTGEYYPSAEEAWYTALVIPQDFSKTEVKLQFKITFPDDSTKDYDVTLSDYPVGSTADTKYSYLAGNKYVYDLSISGSAIACQVNVVDWIEDDFIELN